MTTPDAGHVDPDIQEHWDRAARELEKRLRPHMVDHTAWPLAHQFVMDMAAQGFRPPLRPPKPPPPRIDPGEQRAAYQRGLAAARDQLQHRDGE